VRDHNERSGFEPVANALAERGGPENLRHLLQGLVLVERPLGYPEQRQTGLRDELGRPQGPPLFFCGLGLLPRLRPIGPGKGPPLLRRPLPRAVVAGRWRLLGCTSFRHANLAGSLFLRLSPQALSEELVDLDVGVIEAKSPSRLFKPRRSSVCISRSFSTRASLVAGTPQLQELMCQDKRRGLAPLPPGRAEARLCQSKPAPQICPIKGWSRCCRSRGQMRAGPPQT
jgi:hypothetical protein